MSGLFSDGCGDATIAARSISIPAGGNCRFFKLWMMGVAADESSCSSSARSRSDKLDSESDSEPLPPARRRWRTSRWSADAFMASMASSHVARDRALPSIEGPVVEGVVGADLGDGPSAGVGVTGLLNRLRRAGLFFPGVNRPERAGLRTALFSKLITFALTFDLSSPAPASSELDES